MIYKRKPRFYHISNKDLKDLKCNDEKRVRVKQMEIQISENMARFNFKM